MAASMGVLNSFVSRVGMGGLMLLFVCLVSMAVRMFISVLVRMDIFVALVMHMLTLVFVPMIVFLVVCTCMTVRMRFAVVTFLAARSRMDVEFDSLDIFPLGPIDVDMEIANREFGKLPLQCLSLIHISEPTRLLSI